MGKVVNIVYGCVLIWLALEALWLDILPNSYLPIAIASMGAIILLTPFGSSPYGALATPRPFFQRARRWFFGIIVVFMGLVSAVDALGSMFPYLTLDSTSGAFILLGIAAIYFFSAFSRTATVGISSI